MGNKLIMLLQARAILKSLKKGDKEAVLHFISDLIEEVNKKNETAS